MPQQHIKRVYILNSTLLPETLEIWGKPKKIFIKKNIKKSSFKCKNKRRAPVCSQLGNYALSI